MDKRLRVLVVDDETGLCDFISHYLKTQGFEVEVAFRAKQALEILEQGVFDVVLADIMMPSMDGLELLRRVKEAKPEIVVVMMTAYASLDKAMKAIAYGASDLLIKPFELGQLVQVINKSVSEARLLLTKKTPPTTD